MLTIHATPEQTIEGTGAALRAGWTSCIAILDGCLARIEEWEPKVRAWVVVDSAAARERAKALDAELAEGKCRGPLHGIPIGVKDIIDVKGLPTAAGFAPWSQRVASADAPIVAALRHAGAVILGKTVTTQFAWIDPPITRNPWNLERTPGGSSSGSAAAVAAGMCLGALGTQTGGSIIRPSSFCGICGFKPSYDELPVDGIVPFAPRLDHPGPIARTAHDLRLLFNEILAHLERDESCSVVEGEPQAIAEIESLAATFRSRKPLSPRLLRPRGFFDRRADPDTLAVFEQALARLAEAGATVVDREDEEVDFEAVLTRHRLIMAAEAAAWHEPIFSGHKDQYAKHIRALVEEGMELSAHRFVRAERDWGMRLGRRTSLNGAEDYDVEALVTPATVGPAPDADTTGNPCMNSPFSYFGWPAVVIPCGLSPEGMPLGLQLVGLPALEADDDLLVTATWCEDVLRKAGPKPEGAR